MPNDVNEKNVKATVENGVLKVTMSVKKESENVIQIL
jgi:HSP20 family molecular chaperone IbpA